MTLLDKLEKLIAAAQNCELRDSFFQTHHDLIQSVADELQLSPKETVMLLPFIDESESTLNKTEVSDFFGCSSITLMRYTNELHNLLHRRYLIHRQSYNGKQTYSLNPYAEQALCKNKPLPIINTTGLTPMGFLKHFDQIVVETVRRHTLDEEDLLLETTDLIKGNQQLIIAQKLEELQVSYSDKLILLYFCKRLVINKQAGVPLNEVDMLLDDLEDEQIQEILDGQHPFVQKGLLSPMEQDNLFKRDVYKLTAKARRIFLEEYELQKGEEIQEMDHINLITSKEIKPKTLYYSAEDQHQIDTLSQLLDDKQLKAIRKRLQQANLRKGFNCLFYGGPGTGKTETALQLARVTGRDIMQVDISSIRDKWYGETEKIVQQIFVDYAQQVRRSKRIPILLINEADAILSVRTPIGSSNPTLEKTENAIQNILLQAMENIEGIMIATTNLTCNLDPAFDRRFLYKVEFHQPSVEAKTHIWQSFLPDLVDDDAQALASTYDFSGGQIENIARKVFVDKLLFGHTDFEHILELCAKEQISGRNNSSRKPIGFNN